MDSADAQLLALYEMDMDDVTILKVPATIGDLEGLADDERYELIDGVLYRLPRPIVRHQVALGELVIDLQLGWGSRAPGGARWFFLAEPNLVLAQDVYCPDVVGYRVENLAELPDVNYVDKTPDWICEVLSPGTTLHDRKRKLPRFAAAGVPHVWLVDPKARDVEILRLQGGQWVLVGTFGETDKMRAEPFTEIEIDLSRWWLKKPPPMPVAHEPVTEFGAKPRSRPKRSRARK